MPDGSDYHELGPQKEAPMPIKMAAETIARDETKPNQDSYFPNAELQEFLTV